MELKKFSADIAGKTLSVETGLLAIQAHGSVKVQYGDTVVLATATMSKDKREEMTFFPLFVDYEERYYAAGKIKGSRFIKREGRPSDQAILNGRIIDRTIRPLFNERMRNEIQVIVTVMSIDKENDPIIAAITAASLALGISNIPWNGPVGAVRIGKIDNDFIVNPVNSQLETSEFDLLLSSTEDKINMMETSAKESTNETIAKAIEVAFEQSSKIASFQNQIIEEIGKKKDQVDFTSPSEEFTSEIVKLLQKNKLAEAFYTKDKKEQESKMDEIKKTMGLVLEEKFSEEELSAKKEEASLIFENYLNEVLHKRVLESDERPDGRKMDEVRALSAQVGVLPRTHGTGLFQRGETQVMTIATLGSPGDEQIIDTMEVDEKRRYIHHYNFPPFSVGEVRPMRGPGRREIGHGALAEKALLPVLPDKESFPYTLLLVSEVLSSNGSSSMASTCGSTLALMDAGVPIKKPVSGIAMGIIMGEDGNYKILSDIQGPEDHWGDMDFKVAGTEDGITAMQLDVKIDGITPEIATEVLERAYQSRMTIMKVILAAINEPHKELSRFAPRIITLKINPDKIRDVIGPGGKVINEIIDSTGVQIDIEDDGSVFITAEEAEGGEKAKQWVEALTKEAKQGEIYKGKVTRLMNFGAFVEILPGKEGLVHISQISNERVEKVEDHLKIGQVIMVKVAEIDAQGRTNLTMKGLDQKQKEESAPK
ncbi:MAG: polyribonucleotide nucleotidyltransferase [Patescibacteria group bacterium]|nr:polyribonucleotide nucleotidyltransferase [Patescibacteria group bacterium]